MISPKNFPGNLPGNVRQNIEIIQGEAFKNVEIHNRETAEGIPRVETMKNVDISRCETLQNIERIYSESPDKIRN